MNIKSVRINVEKPNWKQWWIMVSCNFLLWIMVRLFRNNEKKLFREMREVANEAYKAIRDCA